MTTPKQYLVSAVAAAIAIPAVLSGCTAQPSDSEVSTSLQKSMSSEVPHVTSALVSLGHDGSERTVVVRLYLDDVQQPVLTDAVDKATGIAWLGTPTEPSSVIISLVDGLEPPGASTSDIGGVNLSATASALGFQGGNTAPDGLIIYRVDLAKKYGAWHAPSSK